MKILKITIYALLGILSIYLVSNLFFEKEFKVSTSIDIDSSPYIVYDQINNFENWENWDPWIETDTTIKMIISDLTYGVGAYRIWNSENSGNGKMEITGNDYIKQIDFEITIDDTSPFNASFYLESIDNGVKVSWENSGELPFLARIFGPVISKMMKGDHQKGLDNLKRYCESIPSKSGEINIQKWNSKKIIAIRDSCSSSNISQSLAKIYKQTFDHLTENDLAVKGSPFAQHLSFPQKPGDNDWVILRAGVFVENFGDTAINKIDFYETSPTLSAQATHYGDYRTTFDTHQKIRSYCKENNYSIVGSPYEIYTSDPSKTSNSDEWETRIIYEIE
jgi:effector-binding domain-containing protein